MKKYLQNRNEQLFNKLFESQNIKAELDEASIVIDEPAPKWWADMEQAIGKLEDTLRSEVDAKIRAGSTPDNMAEWVTTLATLTKDLVRGLDDKIAYKFAVEGYESPLADINEIGVPEMTAWQNIDETNSTKDEDDDETNEEQGVILPPDEK